MSRLMLLTAVTTMVSSQSVLAQPDQPRTGDTSPSAQSSSLPLSQVRDPLERYNREIYRFNLRVDRAVLRPVAVLYRKVTPGPMVRGVNRFLDNLSEPAHLVNHFLQGRPRAGLINLSRFTLNTVTSLGFADLATRKFDLPRQTQDFGQTLGKWGVPSGPFLMLPFLGPATARDAAGRLVDRQLTVHRWMDTPGRVSITGLDIINTRAALLGLDGLVDSGDGYVLLRDVYLQRRQFTIRNAAGEADTDAPVAPVVEDSFGDEEAVPADPATSDTTTSDTAPDTTMSAMTPDSGQTGAEQTSADQPDTKQSDTQPSDAAQPDTTRPDALRF